MGFSNETSGKTFFSTYNGKFVIKTKEDMNDKSITSRTNKNGKVVFEKSYPAFTGKLVNLYTEKHEEYGMQMAYDFVSDNQIYCFKTGLYGSQADSINRMLPNIDVAEEFTLHAIPTEGNGTDVILSQDGKYAKRFWTKNDPKGIPAPKPVKVKGKDTWDYSDAIVFVLKYLNEHIKPKLTPVDTSMQKVAQEYSGAPEVHEEEHHEITTDDLPF